jgi:hypothetical protein
VDVGDGAVDARAEFRHPPVAAAIGDGEVAVAVLRKAPG